MRNVLDLTGSWHILGLKDGEGSATDIFQMDIADASEWLEATVPGTVQTDLVRAGKYPDPYFSDNSKLFGELEELEWWYRKGFAFSPDPAAPEVHLVCEGLDTLAEIWLNEEFVARHENMFVPLRVNVTDKLRAGENVLVIKLASAVAYGKRKVKAAGPSITDVLCERCFVRKCQIHYGWDSAARLVPTGIFAPVRLEAGSGWRIADLRVQRQIVSRDHARLNIETSLEALAGAGEVHAEVTVVDPDGNEIARCGAAVDTEEKPVLWRCHIDVPNPQLWWPNGYGEQPLYTVRATIAEQEECLDERTARTGICEITVEQPADPKLPKRQFVVHVNGQPIFCQGSNWVPADYFLHQVDREKYARLLGLARDAHFNMLRIWGGGIYETETFYDLCNELGILIIQDFMFACASYPDYDADFCEAVRVEAEAVVKRLRNHPCLAIWAGCNENAIMPFGQRIYEEILQGICRRLDPDHFYLPTCPGLTQNPDSWKAGDRHVHQIFIGSLCGPKDEGAGFFLGFLDERGRGILPHFGMRLSDHPPQLDELLWTALRDENGSFLSETLALPGVPVESTRRAMFGVEAEYPRSDAWLHHVPKLFPSSQPVLDLFLRDLFGFEPPDAHDKMDGYLRRMELIQVEAYRYGFEHTRCKHPSCSGILAWMFSTTWPNMDWSIVDYFGWPTPGYFAAKRASAPIIIALLEDSDAMNYWDIWACNDSPARLVAESEWGLMSFTGEVLAVEKAALELEPYSRQRTGRLLKEQLPPHDPQRDFLFAQLRNDSGELATNRSFFTRFKFLQFSTAILTVEKLGSVSDLQLQISTDAFAWAVKIETSPQADLCDNCFDLLPGGEKTISLRGRDSEFHGEISISAINSDSLILHF